MSDLIRKSDVLGLLYKIFDEYNMSTDKTSKLRTFGSDVFNAVRGIPTAYSVDNVVEELESNSFITVNQEEVQTKRKDIQSYISVEKEVILLKDAIEIVKQGGDGTGTEAETIRDKAVKWNNNSTKKVPYEFIEFVEGKREIGVSDDVCEWNLDGVYIFSPHSKMFSCVIDDKHRYTYCPVCGKKIKVVDQ